MPDLLEIVQQDSALTKRGKDWWGLCPMHVEKTPSFSVSEEKQMYYCFGCGKGGDAITYLRDVRRLSFREAAEQVGKILTLPPSKKKPAADLCWEYFERQYTQLFEEWVLVEWAARSIEKNPDLYPEEERMEWAEALMLVHKWCAALDTLWQKVEVATHARQHAD